MKYYVVEGENGNRVAVLFHNYISAEFVVRSISESFRLSFEASVSVNSGISFVKKSNKLSFNTFGPQHPSWMHRILSNICGDFWKVSSTGNVAGEAFVEDIVNEFLVKTP